MRKAPSGNMEEALVESNMHIVYSVPKHRHYMRSGYSSEPILAEAAANLMHTLRKQPTNDNVHPKDRIANVLKRHVENGLISKGELGELTGRLLLIMAIDSAQEAAQRIKPRWSKPLGVIDFMRSLMGNENYEKHIKNCVPDNGTRESLTFERHFQNSVVRFTHFARAEDDSSMTTRAALSAFVRGFAIQCHPLQRSADVGIPVLINKDGPVTEENMTFIFISFKNRSRGLNIRDTAINADLLGCFPETGPTASGRLRSYISLIMEFGIQPQVPSQSKAAKSSPETSHGTLKRDPDVLVKAGKKPKTAPSGGIAPSASCSTIDSNWQGVRHSDRIKLPPVHPRYLVRICGCSPTVYGVVHNKDVYAHLLHTHPIFNEHARDGDFLAAVQRLMPFFKSGPDGDGIWFNDSEAIATQNVAAGVTADVIEVGKPDLNSDDEGL